MTREIRQVRDGARKILDVILSKRSSQIEDLIHISLNDPDVLVNTVVKSTDLVHFEASLAAVKVHGDDNRDWPEPTLRATKLALEQCLPGSDIYVFTDAPAKDYILFDDVVRLCQKKQTQVVYVLTADFEGYYNYENVKVFFKIAQACSGQAFIIKKKEVSKIPSYITETVKGTKNMITSRQIAPNKSTNITFTIDDKTEYALISSSGKEIQLEVNGPNIKTERNMWTSNVKVLKLINPIAGDYTAQVWSSQYASLYIFGRTDFTFVHGFSELIPKSLQDTISQPISEIKTAQILDMDENIIKEIPLNKVNEDMYTTDALLWPTSMFKVAIIGTSEKTGGHIRRIANTPIEAQKYTLPENKIPVATISEGAKTAIDYNSSLLLTCRVSAYPSPNIVWTDNQGTKLITESSAVELPYSYISYLRKSNIKLPGKYFCFATNNQGTSTTESIDVNINSPFIVEDHDEGVIRIAYGKDIIVKCTITSKFPMKITWKHYDQIIQKWIDVVPKDGKYSISDDEAELKILSIDLYQDGYYSCSVMLKDDGYKGPTIIKTVLVTNLIRPLFDKKGGKIVAQQNDSVIISCKVRLGKPKPKVELIYRNVNSDTYKFINLTNDELVIESAGLRHAGRYKCMAVNIAGRDDAATELFVEGAPTIINIKTTINAVTNDISLRIPCKVEGYPKPEIAWQVNETQVISGEKFVIDDYYLIINNPDMNDTNYYICTATNKKGTEQKRFKVQVNPNLISNDTFGNWREIFLTTEKAMNLSCSLPISLSDTVRWFLFQD
ncbi:hemicentin-1-like [Achroia grisella]|uniref:hemicentin-1-like n=1 Tax=Achroia grisella TaxID=688607 RepID=UPI0027D31732|nr:hemicentin-1-like [Achroia grisella]